jgi:hypothetical protein
LDTPPSKSHFLAKGLHDFDFRTEKAMANTTLEELKAENQELRDLIVSIAFALLRNIALNPPKDCRDVSSADADQLLKEADIFLRCAKIAGLNNEIAEGLASAGNELMARAVEIETKLQREKWKK